MTCARLRLAGLIRRLDQTHRYVLTPDGIKVAVFYTDLHNRLLRPLLAAAQPPAPAERRDAQPTLVRTPTPATSHGSQCGQVSVAISDLVLVEAPAGASGLQSAVRTAGALG
jgi:hypothetical protein